MTYKCVRFKNTSVMSYQNVAKSRNRICLLISPFINPFIFNKDAIDIIKNLVSIFKLIIVRPVSDMRCQIKKMSA